MLGRLAEMLLKNEAAADSSATVTVVPGIPVWKKAVNLGFGYAGKN